MDTAKTEITRFANVMLKIIRLLPTKALFQSHLNYNPLVQGLQQDIQDIRADMSQDINFNREIGWPP